MQLSEFCEYNQQEYFENQEIALKELENIFGSSTEVKGKNGIEYSFGQVIGKVTNCYKNEKKNLEMVEMIILDSKLQEVLWHGKTVGFTRTNAGRQMKKGQYYLQSLFYNGSEIFARNPSLYEVPSDVGSLYTLKDKLEAQGYHCNIKVLAQFLLGLYTNQIIILHGAPGMGKTSFVSNIAKALGFEYKIIPVRPNWIDNQDLTGYFNPVEHRYYSTTFLDALCEAKENLEKNYLICLDEMNLAHVEYYFSDVLSSMESGEAIPLYAKKDWEDALRRLDFILEKQDENRVEWLDAKIDQKNLRERYRPEFAIPENVTFIGTLNMDATTNDLSPKVIDRSLVIKVTKDEKESFDNCRLRDDLLKEVKDGESFEKRLLKALNKQMSNRVEVQLNNMRARLESKYLKGILSESDFQDIYLVTKVLPSLNVEDVECTLEDGLFQIGDFEIEGGDRNWKDIYPLTVEYLKQMCSPQEGILNYWKV